MSGDHVFSSSQEIAPGQRSPTKNKKRKHKEIASSTELDTTQDEEVTFKQPKANLNDTEWTDVDKEIHIWTANDIRQMMTNLEAIIMELEGGSKSCLGMEKIINWNDVKFGRFTAFECQFMWVRIQKRVRKNRTMREFCDAANQIVTDEVKAILNFQKARTPEEIYIDKKIGEYTDSHPEVTKEQATEYLLGKYETLSERRKSKYIEKAKEMKKEVLKQKGKDSCPRPPHPVDFYVESKLKAVMDKNPELTEHQATLQCRSKYKTLKESRQIKYINKSIEAFPNYQRELKEYLHNHPNTEVKINTSSCLQKQEKVMKFKHDGIPQKPPNSGFSLFSQELLRNEEFMNEHSSNQRFQVIAEKWKTLPADEKQEYIDQFRELKETYIVEIKEKLLSFPEEERELLSQTINLPTLESLDGKKKKKPKPIKLITDYMTATKKKKKKKANGDMMNGDSDELVPLTFPGEPLQKKMNGFALFTQEKMPTLLQYKAAERLKVVGTMWRELDDDDKQNYKDKAKEENDTCTQKLLKFKESLGEEERTKFEAVLERRRGGKVKTKQKKKPIVVEVKAEEDEPEEVTPEEPSSEVDESTA